MIIFKTFLSVSVSNTMNRNHSGGSIFGFDEYKLLLKSKSLRTIIEQWIRPIMNGHVKGKTRLAADRSFQYHRTFKRSVLIFGEARSASLINLACDLRNLCGLFEIATTHYSLALAILHCSEATTTMRDNERTRRMLNITL